MEEDTYTPAEAAKILRYSERHVRKLLTDGELQGERDEAGRWRVYQRSVHEMLPDRPPRVGRAASLESLEGPERVRELSERMESLYDRIAALQHDLGRAQARSELTELAESTLREQLERERERAESERLRAEEERQRADGERERALELEIALRQAQQQRSWWRRILGQ